MTAISRARSTYLIAALMLTVLLAGIAVQQLRNRAPGAIVLLVDAPFVVLAAACWAAGLSESPRTRRVVVLALKTGFGLGGVGFVFGFFGPLLLSQSNLGPLLGILVTGPAGFVVGALAGAIYGATQPQNPREEPAT